MVGCCVPGCSMKSDNANKFSMVKFYRFPTNAQRRELWKTKIGRKDWTPSNCSRICSIHFTTGRRVDDPQHPDWSPSVFPAANKERAVKSDCSPSIFKRCTGKRKHTDSLESSNYQQCQSLIRVRTTEDHGHLYIKELRDVHNHEPEGDSVKRPKGTFCYQVVSSTTTNIPEEVSPLENYLQAIAAADFDASSLESLSGNSYSEVELKGKESNDSPGTVSKQIPQVSKGTAVVAAVSTSKSYELSSSAAGEDALTQLQMQHAEEVHRARMIQLQRSIQLAEDEHQARMELIRRKLEVADLKYEYWTEQRKLQQKQ